MDIMSGYKNKEEGKDHESIQSSTKPDPVLHKNTITVYNYGFLLNCTTRIVGQASDSMTKLA